MEEPRYLHIFEGGEFKLYRCEPTSEDVSMCGDGYVDILNLNDETYLTRDGEWHPIEVG